jgi:signal transduction histidine kinase
MNSANPIECTIASVREHDGVLYIVFNGVMPTIETARELASVLKRITSGRRMPAIFDSMKASIPAMDVQEYFRSDEYTSNMACMAVIAASNSNVMLGRLFSSFFKVNIPMLFFRSETEALSWIATSDFNSSSNANGPATRKPFDIEFNVKNNLLTVSYNRPIIVDEAIATEIRSIAIAKTKHLKTLPLLLVRNENALNTTHEARLVIANVPIQRLAIVSSNSFAYFRGKFFMKFATPKYPMNVFLDEKKALNWLLNGADTEDRTHEHQDPLFERSQTLIRMIEKYSQGEFETTDLSEYDDLPTLQYLGAAIQILGTELSKKISHIEDMNAKLEAKVELRTKELLEERLRSEKQERMALVGNFAAGIAHEVNNPLAVIASATELARMKKAANKLDDLSLNKTLEQIQSMALRIGGIIRTVMNISRDSSEDPMKRETASVIMHDAVTLLEAKLHKVGIQLSIEGNQNEDLFCRRGEISQVLVNFIGNAKDAIESLPQADRWIKLSHFAEDDHYVFRVINGGPLIPSEIKAKIGNPFFTSKAIGKGTGLGISLSRAIARQHGGSITIVDGPHTCFELRIPRSEACEIKNAS